MKRKRLHESRHPFNALPFEALCCGSWQSVELLQIRDGAMTVHFVDSHHSIEENGPFSNIRVKSRKATSSDCTCFLRPGVDVCVLSSSERAKNTGEGNSEPVWVDAKISSIKRKPHVSHCSCQFFVNLYVNQGRLGSERATLSKETEAVGINEISIVQKLDNDPCEADNNQQEAQFYRWECCVDCSLVQRSKLFKGRFSADLTWLLVASVLKQVEFDVRAVQNKIVYQILGGEKEQCSLKFDNRINCVTFKVKDSILTPFVVQLVPTDACSETGHISDTNGTKQSPCYDVASLRRSKRQNVQPERFLACDAPAETEIGWVRSLPYMPLKWKAAEDDDEEMHLPLAYLFGTHASASFAEEQTRTEVRVSSLKLELLEGIPVSRTKTGLKDIKSIVVNRREHQTELGEVQAGMAKRIEHRKSGADKRRKRQKSTMDDRIEHQTRLGDAESGMANRKKHGTQIKEVKLGVANRREHNDQLAIVPVHTEDVLVTFEQFDSPVKTPEHYSQECIEFPISYYRKKSPAVHMKNDLDEDSMFANGRGRKFSTKKVQRARYRSTHLKQDDSCATMTYKRTALSAGAYNKLISSYMKNIDATIKSKEIPRIIDQWEEFKAKHSSDQKEKMELSSVEDDGQSSETEMLWREMELCLASAYILEDNEALVSTQTTQNSDENCQHEFKLDEEIGILCQICGFVKTEIKYVSAPFMEHTGWTAESKPQNEEDSELKPDEDEDLSFFGNHTSGEDESASEVNDNVWDLIPELRPKLHMHQKKAFEFLWQNIAGSLLPALMEKTSKKIGGCVVSHTPGAGKTFLIIAFLVSYLKLFPGKRPLVLAPKTTLYTWYKEFIKWEIPVPVHLIHGTRSSRVFKPTPAVLRGSGPRPSQDVVHILDCLEKMQKWHAQPSVLVMGYTSFLTLMREDAKYSHRKYMAKVLRESPGLLILDEGHNPRSTKSRLRKVLMKVETDQRILLSGTLFQNNFCEYFNTLSLARPMFIKEVLKTLDPKFKRKKKGAQKARHLLESRARKFFLDNIASKINSDEAEEKMQGLNMLRNMTNGFIDVYEGTASDTLPGLQIYTILMNPTDIQHQILVKLHKIMEKCPGYPLEVELLITLASIHPSLINSSLCVKKFYSMEELMELERLRFDCKKGSKVMFVLNLVYRVVKNEKVLIFCHNIAPIKLFLELFENIFRWQQGKEVLVLTGELELFERGRVMDKFEELGGPSRVLLASITACAEGISLTAASRVILLDSEWNPSKTKQAIARAFRPGQQKMVYVYQLLATGTVEEDKYRRTAWKEWVSRMIFSEEFVEDPSRWQAEKIEDDVLREIVAAAPTAAISSVGTLTQSRFHWYHAVFAVGLLAASGAGTVVLVKNTIIPRLKSWIRKVVLEEEDENVKKTNLKPSLAEEAAAAAKSAAAAAADVARTSQELLNSKDEEKRYLKEFMNMLDVQVQEMKSMSTAIHRLEGHKDNHVRSFVADQEDYRASVANTKQAYTNGRAEFDLQPGRSSSQPASAETSVAPHPQSYMEIMEMVKRGEKPANIRDINDQPPNPSQRISNPRMVPRAKEPWEVGQVQNNSSQVLQSQVSGEGLNSKVQDNGIYEFDGESNAPWWQHKNAIAEIDTKDEVMAGSYGGQTNQQPVRRTWVPPQPPPAVMPEAAEAIRRPKQSIQKEQVEDDQSVSHPADAADELQRITKISESGGTVEINGGGSLLNSSEIQEEPEQIHEGN